MTERPASSDLTGITLSMRRAVERCEIVSGRGALDRLPALLDHHAPAPRYAIVSDSNVAPLHGATVAKLLERAGRAAHLITFPAGEAHKTPAEWASVVEELGRVRLGRDGCVVAVGGGVTGDLAGFAAASFGRGVAFVQVPTTLLAMVDASMGGKTGVDLAAGKNLVGAFHQPRLVLIDPATLVTLPAGSLADGLAEAIKHGAVADAAYMDWIADAASSILDQGSPALDLLISGSVRIKTAIVERDGLESGERAVLNFGHTIAHAIERVTDYAVGHGHAVAMGMVAEAAVGERAGVSRAGTADRIRRVLAAADLPTAIPAGLDPGRLLDAAGSDKKARAGLLRYTLLAEPGTPARTADGAWTHPVPDDIVRAVLTRLTAPSQHGVDV